MNITLSIMALALLATPALAQDEADHAHDQAPAADPQPVLEPTTQDMLIPAITFDAAKSNEVRVARSANGLILFPAIINGQDLGWWLLDTGSEQNVIDVRAAREAGLAEAGSVVTKDFNGIEQTSPTFAGFSLTTGNITIDQPRVVGVSTIPIASSVGQPVIGIIGASTLSQVVLELDYLTPLAKLNDPNSFEGEALEWTDVGLEGFCPVIDATFDTIAGTFVINTGLGTALNFTRDAVRDNRLVEGRDTRDWKSVWVGGRKEVQLGFIEEFTLLGEDYRAMPAMFEDPDGYEGVFPNQTGMIGSLFLRHYLTTFDLGQGRIAFTPVDRAPPAGDMLLVDMIGTYRDRATGGSMILTWDGERVTAILGAGQPELEVNVRADSSFYFPAAWINGRFMIKDKQIVGVQLNLPDGRGLKAKKID
ncbi:MAG: hypothetical protein ACI89L_001789 [Phycisphaerales bacterium]|jgi:hypothetical protein